MCLLIGVTFLMMCLLGADIMSGFSENALMRALRESLIIGGWVAMWRSLQIFCTNGGQWFDEEKYFAILLRLAFTS
jgi:hypothetical protein